MKEIWMKGKLMVMAFIYIVIKQNMRVSEKMIIKKALEWKNGWMEQNFKGIINKGKNVEKGGFNG